MALPDKHKKSTTKRKLPKNAWKPGQSGNPNGRPKKGFAISELARDVLGGANKYDPEKRSIEIGILEKAAERALGGDHYARQWLFELAYGKVPDKLITREDTDGLIIDIE